MDTISTAKNVDFYSYAVREIVHHKKYKKYSLFPISLAINTERIPDELLVVVPGEQGYAASGYSDIKKLNVEVMLSNGEVHALHGYKNTSYGDGSRFKETETRSIKDQIEELKQMGLEVVAVRLEEFDGGSSSICVSIWKFKH